MWLLRNPVFSTVESNFDCNSMCIEAQQLSHQCLQSTIHPDPYVVVVVFLYFFVFLFFIFIFSNMLSFPFF